MVLTGCLWLFPTWLTWGSMARMDTVLVGVNLFSLLVLLKEMELNPSKSLRSWWMAGFLNAAALLLKPSACTLTLAVFLIVVLKRKWKEGFAFLSVALIPVLLVTAYWQWKTNGLYLIHTYKWAAQDFNFSVLWGFLSGSFLKEGGWLVLGVVVTLFKRPLPLLLKLQLLFSALWLLGLSRNGSAENYYMEFFMVGILVLGEGWFVHNERYPVKSEMPLLCLALAGLYLGLQPGPGSPSYSQMAAEARGLTFFADPGEYLTLDTDLPYQAGRRIWYQHSGLLPLINRGLWDPAPLIRDITDKKFLKIEMYDLPSQFLWPESVTNAVERNYKMFAVDSGRRWYLPR